MARLFSKRLLVLIGAGALAVIAAGTVNLQAQDTRSLKGQPAPDITLNSLDGSQFRLSDHRGNVVLLDYWATWCPPCVRSLPPLSEMANDPELAARGLRVFAINARETPETIRPFLERHNLRLNVPLDPNGEFGTAYRVRGIPTAVIVGRDGIITDVFVGFGDGTKAQMQAAVEAALRAGQ